ncbi:hypothetical protein BLNAU_19836 [Blattamonas nauphoetae]|uniref:Uncharacterized protein n=1 Tax=Blattamonas nauphoetae TaxID=2049346 RepID=A0ABQ9X0G9_9EUKA|nr:hypothetical protein BLNAU_19836 [Blattamonas nauphoetae]
MSLGNSSEESSFGFAQEIQAIAGGGDISTFIANSVESIKEGDENAKLNYIGSLERIIKIDYRLAPFLATSGLVPVLHEVVNSPVSDKLYVAASALLFSIIQITYLPNKQPFTAFFNKILQQTRVFGSMKEFRETGKQISEKVTEITKPFITKITDTTTQALSSTLKSILSVVDQDTTQPTQPVVFSSPLPPLIVALNNQRKHVSDGLEKIEEIVRPARTLQQSGYRVSDTAFRPFFELQTGVNGAKTWLLKWINEIRENERLDAVRDQSWEKDQLAIKARFPAIFEKTSKPISASVTSSHASVIHSLVHTTSTPFSFPHPCDPSVFAVQESEQEDHNVLVFTSDWWFYRPDHSEREWVRSFLASLRHSTPEIWVLGGEKTHEADSELSSLADVNPESAAPSPQGQTNFMMVFEKNMEKVVKYLQTTFRVPHIKGSNIDGAEKQTRKGVKMFESEFRCEVSSQLVDCVSVCVGSIVYSIYAAMEVMEGLNYSKRKAKEIERNEIKAAQNEAIEQAEAKKKEKKDIREENQDFFDSFLEDDEAKVREEAAKKEEEMRKRKEKEEEEERKRKEEEEQKRKEEEEKAEQEKKKEEEEEEGKQEGGTPADGQKKKKAWKKWKEKQKQQKQNINRKVEEQSLSKEYNIKLDEVKKRKGKKKIALDSDDEDDRDEQAPALAEQEEEKHAERTEAPIVSSNENVWMKECIAEIERIGDTFSEGLSELVEAEKRRLRDENSSNEEETNSVVDDLEDFEEQFQGCYKRIYQDVSAAIAFVQGFFADLERL